MVSVAAGWFTSGCTGIVDFPDRERKDYPEDYLGVQARQCVWTYPPRRLWISSFEIDRLEVTRDDYRHCVREGACVDVLAADADSERMRRDDPRTEGRLPARVPFEAAEAFCRWRGVRLPTAAEWEKAARGVDGHLFPWGDEPPTCLHGAVLEWDEFNGITPIACKARLSTVGQYPRGRSPYGAMDMWGNAAEWTSDAFRRPDAVSENDAAFKFTREEHGSYAVIRFDWESARFAWLDPALVDPRGPSETDVEEEDRGMHAVRGNPSIVGWSRQDVLGDHDERLAGLRCVRALGGDKAPTVPAVGRGEFTHPYRETPK